MATTHTQRRPCAWQAQVSEIPGGRQYRILDDGAAMSFRRFFELLLSNDEFCDWYSRTLAAFDAEAFYWELPPLTRSTLDYQAEFVLVEASMLARLPPDPRPFSSHFDSRPGKDILVFPNLGGDAVLVVPSPRGTVEMYPHLAAFLRQGAQDQVRALWRTTAEMALDHLSDNPTWISTAGIGVAWLHLRFDSRPKYYRHRPYAEAR